jgi:hypothetical protein
MTAGWLIRSTMLLSSLLTCPVAEASHEDHPGN